MITKTEYSIALIGAGKVAWSLVPSLKENGYNISVIISRDIKDAEELAVEYKVESFSSELKSIEHSDIIFLTLPDDQLQVVSDKISALYLNDLSSKIFVHLSGVCSSSELKSLSVKGTATASFHIMQTFPSKRRVSTKESYAAIETSDDYAAEFLFKLASDLGLNAFRISADKKAAYHLAGVFASNFLVSNFYAAEELFKSTGSEVDFSRFIEPIVSNTINNIYKNGTLNSLSGPVERGDIKTIKIHIKALSTQSRLLKSYIIQSLNIIDIKKEQGKLSPAHEEIEQLLNEVLKNNSL
jgi:predicted short-subunit dehydrogenase-like oxidoreductase (DUF2520 family)